MGFEHRPGGKHYRAQLDRIERKLAWLVAALFVIALAAVAYVTWRG
jgi:hypothetical protein